jgi:hypothetical protein
MRSGSTVVQILRNLHIFSLRRHLVVTVHVLDIYADSSGLSRSDIMTIEVDEVSRAQSPLTLRGVGPNELRPRCFASCAQSA